MVRISFVVLTAISLLMPVAQACTRLRTVPPHELVASADAIYYARTLGYAPGKKKPQDPFTPWASTVVQFSIIERLKGPKIAILSVNGELIAKDDPNDQKAPYTFVRPGGRHGNCYADTYKRGASYLLLLKNGKPYWSPLAPTTEQIFGPNDPWLQWVKAALSGKRSNNSFKPNPLRGSA